METKPPSARVLVPLDGSRSCERALQVAVQEACWRDAELVLLHCLHFPSDLMWLDKLPWPREWPELVREQAEEYLESKQVSLRGQVRVRYRLEVGEPFAKIDEVARAEKVDLVVMASHGRTGAMRWLLGNVPHQLLARASYPVLLVPISREDPMESNFSGMSF